MLKHTLFFCFFLLCSGLSCGCDGDEVQDYRVAKPSAAPSPKKKPVATGPTVSQRRKKTFLWTLPGGWQTVPRRSPFRLATFAVSSQGAFAECSLAILGGDGGGTLANVNRWRRQMGCKVIKETELAQHLERIKVCGRPGVMIDISGRYRGMGMPHEQANFGMLGAMVPFSGGTMFIKLVGPRKVVTEQKDNFLKFCNSIRPAAEGGQK